MLVDPEGKDIWIGDIIYSANMSSDNDDYDDFSLMSLKIFNI